MEAPYLTVAIVTVGRHEKLERVLRAFSRLDPGSPPFEVVVVIDGDEDVGDDLHESSREAYRSRCGGFAVIPSPA